MSFKRSHVVFLINVEITNPLLKLFLTFFSVDSCLLIYDDVWSPKVLQGIDVQARILITTRDKSVTDSVAGEGRSHLFGFKISLP